MRLAADHGEAMEKKQVFLRTTTVAGESHTDWSATVGPMVTLSAPLTVILMQLRWCLTC